MNKRAQWESWNAEHARELVNRTSCPPYNPAPLSALSAPLGHCLPDPPQHPLHMSLAPVSQYLQCNLTLAPWAPAAPSVWRTLPSHGHLLLLLSRLQCCFPRKCLRRTCSLSGLQLLNPSSPYLSPSNCVNSQSTYTFPNVSCKANSPSPSPSNCLNSQSTCSFQNALCKARVPTDG